MLARKHPRKVRFPPTATPRGPYGKAGRMPEMLGLLARDAADAGMLAGEVGEDVGDVGGDAGELDSIWVFFEGWAYFIQLPTCRARHRTFALFVAQSISSCGRLLNSLHGSGSTILVPAFDCDSYLVLHSPSKQIGVARWSSGE